MFIPNPSNIDKWDNYIMDETLLVPIHGKTYKDVFAIYTDNKLTWLWFDTLFTGLIKFYLSFDEMVYKYNYYKGRRRLHPT